MKKPFHFLLVALSMALSTLHLRAATYTWTGAGFFGNKDYLWSNPNNWAELAAPEPGEQGVQLVFPNSNAPRNTTNDVINLVIKSAVFQGANYAIHGAGANGITMNLRGDNGGAFAIVAGFNGCQFGPSTRLHLASDGTIAVASGATLTIHSRLSGTFGFAKASPGTLSLQGTVANTFTGTTTVLDGALVLRKSGLALPGALVIGDGQAGFSPSVLNFLGDQIGDASPVTVHSNGELLFADVSDTLGNLTLVGGFVDTANGTLHLNGNVLVQPANNGHPSDVRGRLDLGPIGRFFTVEANAVLDLTATIQGGNFGNAAAGVHKNGAGLMMLGGLGNTFGGSLFVGEGTVSVGNGAQLGAITNVTGVASNATLALGQVGFGPVINGRKLSLAGGARVRTAFDSEWNGPIEFVFGQAIFDLTQTNATLTLGGALTGAGGFEKIGPGELIFGGAVDNSYTGASRVLAGRLSLRKVGINTNKLALTGPLVIGEQGTSTNSPKVVVERSEVIAASVVVNFTGSLLLSNAIESIPGLAVNSGYVSMDAASLLALDGPLSSTNHPIREGLIQGRLKLDPQERPLRVQSFSLNIAAAISGDLGDGLHKVGPGWLRLTAANSYPGETHAFDGHLSVEHSQALSSSTSVSNGATLVLAGGIELPATHYLYLRGNGFNGTDGALRSLGTNTVDGHVFILSDSRIEVVNSDGLLRFKGHLLDSDVLRKGGSGVLWFKPGAANASTGVYHSMVVAEGELWLESTFNNTVHSVIHGNLAIGGGVGSPTATVRVLARSQITDGANVLVNKTGRLYFASSTTNSFNGLDGNGLVDLGAQAQVLCGGDLGESHEFSGTLQGGGVSETNLRKLGLGHLTLSGANTLLGQTEVYGGSLWVNSPQPAARFKVTSGTIGGSGSTRTIELHPGSEVAPGSPFGQLRTTSCTVLGSNKHTFEFHGAGGAATGDQFETDSQPDLGKCTLKLSFAAGFNPAVGQQFVLVDNNHAGPTLGTYAGLPDGTEWRPAPTLRFRINYNAGDGNDVVLTTLTPPAPAQLNRVIFNPGLPAIVTGTGLPGDTYDVEATSDLGDPAGWQIIGTATAQAPNGAMNFVDVDAPNFPHRFYRFVLR